MTNNLGFLSLKHLFFFFFNYGTFTNPPVVLPLCLRTISKTQRFSHPWSFFFLYTCGHFILITPWKLSVLLRLKGNERFVGFSYIPWMMTRVTEGDSIQIVLCRYEYTSPLTDFLYRVKECTRCP